MSTVLRRRWVRVVAAPVTAVGLAAGLVACGAATGTGGTGSGTQAGSSADTDMQAFASCMAENGVTLPARGADGGSPPSGAPSASGSGGSGAAGGTPPSGAPAAGGVGGAGQGGAGQGGGQANGGQSGPGQVGGDQAGGAMQAPPGVDATAWAAAQKACAQYAPTRPTADATS